MKSPPFSYRAAASVGEAAVVLAEFGTGAVVLAGGQSLLIDLHFRRRTGGRAGHQPGR